MKDEEIIMMPKKTIQAPMRLRHHPQWKRELMINLSLGSSFPYSYPLVTASTIGQKCKHKESKKPKRALRKRELSCVSSWCVSISFIFGLEILDLINKKLCNFGNSQKTIGGEDAINKKVRKRLGRWIASYQKSCRPLGSGQHLRCCSSRTMVVSSTSQT